MSDHGVQAAAVIGGAEGLDQEADPGGVDEAQPSQVHDHAGVLAELIEKPSLYRRDGAQLELAREDDDGRVRSHRFNTHFEQPAVAGRAPAGRRWLAGWSAPARPLHPLASTPPPLE